ncbi:MAG TPA: GNAT family N-acetyltransferase [Mucilaginibacter sp.]|nr:GNAT family N-acetyltransferase [Mucilaginibacter sp.]
MLTIKLLKAKDISLFLALLRLFEEVFEMKDHLMPPEHHLKALLADDAFTVLVAMDNDRMVGGLTAHTIHSYYHESPEMYIYDLAVATDHQRKGIGTKLLQTLEDHCRANGYREIFVQADMPDIHALEFYRSTGGNAEQVVHFTYPINEK